MPIYSQYNEDDFHSALDSFILSNKNEKTLRRLNKISIKINEKVIPKTTKPKQTKKHHGFPAARSSTAGPQASRASEEDKRLLV